MRASGGGQQAVALFERLSATASGLFNTRPLLLACARDEILASIVDQMVGAEGFNR